MDHEIQAGLRFMHRWWWLLALGVLVGGGVAFGYTLTQPELYKSTVRLLVYPTRSTAELDPNAVLAARTLAETYRQLVTSRTTLEAAIDEVGVPDEWQELADNIDVGSPRDTQLIAISVSYDDPEIAASLANAVGDQFVNDAAGWADAITATPIAEIERQHDEVQTRIGELEQEINRLEQETETSNAQTLDRIDALRAEQTQQRAVLSELEDTARAMELNASASRAQLVVVEPAQIPSASYSPHVVTATILGAIAGFLVALLSAGLWQIVRPSEVT